MGGDSSEESSDDSGINITLGKIIAYPVGILLLLSGLGGFTQSVAAGVFLLLAGILSLPIVRSRLKQSQGIAINRWATVGIVIVLVIAGGSMIGGTGNGDTSSGETEEITHQMGESFTVGDDSESIQYTVQNAYETSYIDSGLEQEEADGKFVIIILSMENVGDESVDITTNHLTIVDSQDRTFDASSEQSIWVEQDARFQVEGITFDQLQPGVTTEGAAVFEVPEEESELQFKIEPTGVFSNADEHYVELETEQLEE
ncbi:DUF4352 domain-containing protein [Natronomonas sp. F2-12]|uniref:DUF4352 domain-containing protein n=1 Tax=Natronomonas aquatica TaxID=2841590 RepID=A0A9R1D532_9EURY|nr:DUF4352 domain-containing protein [Natronomonas aquatica]MCQ4331948.1 DUF4352 domain-containing protein [Natronomonas aquatica]